MSEPQRFDHSHKNGMQPHDHGPWVTYADLIFDRVAARKAAFAEAAALVRQ